jgi:Peptidase family S41
MILRRVLVVGLICATLCIRQARQAIAVAAPGTTESQSTSRLIAVARLWGAIEYFDPDVAGYRSAEWANALATSLPAIEAAGSSAEYAAAVQQMLATLNDPATHVVSQLSASPLPAGPEFQSQVQDGVAILRIGDLSAFAQNGVGLDSTVDKFVKGAAASKGVVLDLRASRPMTADEADGIDNVLGPDALAPLFSGAVSTPSIRGVTYSGLPPAGNVDAGFYTMSFQDTVGYAVYGGTRVAIPTSIIVNHNSEIPPLLLGLIGAGRCHVIVDGSPPSLAASVTTIPLTEGISAVVRSSDYTVVLDPAAPGVTTLAAGSDPAAAAKSAVAALARPSATGKPALSPVEPPASAPIEPSYDSTLPTEPNRLLAAFEIYNAVRYFFPYAPLMHDDWDAALGDAIPELRRASSPREYYLAVARLYAHIHDTHGFINSRSYAKYFFAGPPIFTRYLHSEAVVTDFRDPGAALAGGAQIGDVVLAIDGEPTSKAILRWQPYVNASTPQRSVYGALRMAMAGESGTQVSLLVRTPNGSTKLLKFIRGTKPYFMPQRIGPVFRILAGNVGYVDLARLRVDDVDAMFSALRGTRAIVFDDRGYPNGTAWSIAPRLTTRDRVKFSLFEIPLVQNMAPEDATTANLPTMTRSYDLVPSAQGKARYLHPTVLLIDEQTLSQAEYTGMMLRAAGKTVFVGTPTAGADGNVTNFIVPGGLQLWFSGATVRWPDGRQTQRVGLQPDIRAEPTAADVSQGKDVVLLAGLRVALLKAGATSSEASRFAALEQASEMRARSMRDE